MLWNIVCDSSCDLTSAVLIPEKLLLTVVPMTITVENEHYRDDEALDPLAMLAHMNAAKGPSCTSCPSVEAFASAFRQADRSLCFTISGRLSGTWQAACAARDLVREEDPEKQIFVLDSRSTAGSMVLLMRKARAMLEAGEENFETLCTRLQDCRDNLGTVFTLEAFDNLVKNGRMRPLLGTVLHTLGIHVIAAGTDQGTIQVVDKARGKGKTVKALVGQMEKKKDCEGAEVVISHCDNPQGARDLRKAILEKLPVKSVTVLPCRGLTTYYAMDKGLIVVF
jgi:DegV family protein with EDD domain